MLAMDRSKDLEPRLRQWIAADDPVGAWRIILGYLLAEQGRLADAVKLFEAVRDSDDLRTEEFHALAGWCAAIGRPKAHDRAVYETFRTMDENQLSNWISREMQSWGDSETAPRELDAELPAALLAVLHRHGNPQEYLGFILQLHRSSHKVQLPAMLAESLLDQTAERSYSILTAAPGMLSELKEEAPLQALIRRIPQVRSRTKKPMEQRTLDLLEMLVECRVAGLRDDPGPDLDRALVALRRAWRRPWEPGEPGLMAALLQALGEIGQESLAAEQLRQLDRLWRDAPRNSKERSDIAQCLVETLWDYDREDEALDRFSSAVAEQRAAGGGVLPPNNQGDLVSAVVEHLESRKQFTRGEALLKRLIEHAANPQEAERLSVRLYQLYERTIAQDGEVALGRGGALYLAVEQKMQGDLVSLDQNGLITGLLSLYGTAHQRKEFSGVDEDLKRFAFQRLPKLLKRRSAGYEQIVNQTANTLHGVTGPHDAVAFLIERIETDPAWARRQAEENLPNWINTLSQWRREAEYLGELSPRLLRILCEALRKDLQRHDANYPRLQPETFSSWPEKAAAFAAAAEEVLAENKDSETVALHVADFFNATLKQPARAADVLLAANRRHVLGQAAQDASSRTSS